MVTTATATAPAASTNGGNKSITRHQYAPLAPVSNQQGLKGLMEMMKGNISAVIARHITPERLFKTFVTAVNRNPKLLQCTQMSIVDTITRAAELGLDLSGTLGEAYPVPFNNSVQVAEGKWEKVLQCQLIIGYRGFAKLAYQSGEVEYIEAEVVHAGDHFVYRQGTNGTLEFERLLDGDRGPIIGAYALVKMKSGGMPRKFMSTAEIEAVRAKSKNKNGDTWTDPLFKESMYMKTPFRALSKWLPLSTEKFVSALETDNESSGSAELSESVMSTMESGQSRSSALLEDMRGDENKPEMVEGNATEVAEKKPAAKEENAVDDKRPTQEEQPTAIPPGGFKGRHAADGEKRWQQACAIAQKATGLAGADLGKVVDAAILGATPEERAENYERSDLANSVTGGMILDALKKLTAEQWANHA